MTRENTPEPRKADTAYKFDRTAEEQYLDLLREGGRRGLSARAVGVTPQTVQRRVRADEQFAAEVREAESEAHEVIEDALFNAAASGHPGLIMFYLTNRKPDEWADRRSSAVQVSGPGGGPVEVESYTTPLEKIPAVLAALKEAGVLDRVLAELAPGVDDDVVDAEAHEVHPD